MKNLQMNGCDCALFIDTKIWILYFLCQKLFFLFIFNFFQNMKTVLSSWAVQRQEKPGFCLWTVVYHANYSNWVFLSCSLSQSDTQKNTRKQEERKGKISKISWSCEKRDCLLGNVHPEDILGKKMRSGKEMNCKMG